MPRIRDDEGHLTRLGRQLSEQRMSAFVTGHGNLQAQAMFLVMAVVSAPAHAYSDETLECLIADANDVRQAAAAWADSCIELAECWRRQRRAADRMAQG